MFLDWEDGSLYCKMPSRRCLHDTEGRVLESLAPIDMVCVGLCDIAK